MLIDAQYPLEYRAVQAGHAVAEYMLRYPGSSWKNQYLIYLQVLDITAWKEKLDFLGKTYAAFVEPDVGHKVTAIAVEDDGKLFRKLKLN